MPFLKLSLVFTVSLFVLACNQNKGKQLTKEQEDRLNNMEASQNEMKKREQTLEETALDLANRIKGLEKEELKLKSLQEELQAERALIDKHRLELERRAKELGIDVEKALALRLLTDSGAATTLLNSSKGKPYPFLFIVASTDCEEKTQIRNSIVALNKTGPNSLISTDVDCSGLYLPLIDSDERLKELLKTEYKNSIVRAFPFRSGRVVSSINLHYADGRTFSREIGHSPMDVGLRFGEPNLFNPFRITDLPSECSEAVDSNCLSSLSPRLDFETRVGIRMVNLKSYLKNELIRAATIKQYGTKPYSMLNYQVGLSQVIRSVSISFEMQVEGPNKASLSITGIPDRLKSESATNVFFPSPLKIQSVQSKPFNIENADEYANSVEALASSLE